MKKSLFHNTRTSGLLSFGRRLKRNQKGATAVEFAVMAPVLVLFTFGILEFIIGISIYLQASEAVRAAARVAAIRPAIADLSSLDETPAVCSGEGGVSCSGYSVANAASYNQVLAEAQRVLGDITADQLTVTYSSSGVGFSTTANGTAPMVTVSLNGFEHELVLQNLIPGVSSIPFPDFATSRMTTY